MKKGQSKSGGEKNSKYMNWLIGLSVFLIVLYVIRFMLGDKVDEIIFVYVYVLVYAIRKKYFSKKK